MKEKHILPTPPPIEEQIKIYERALIKIGYLLHTELQNIKQLDMEPELRREARNALMQGQGYIDETMKC